MHFTYFNITDLNSVILKCSMSQTSALHFHYAWPHSVCGIQHPVLAQLLPASFHEYITKQERQCVFIHVTLRLHLQNYSCCGKSKSVTYYKCVPSHSYPKCKAHALYYTYSVTFGLSDCTTFIHIISYTARFFIKKLLNIKCVFWFSLQLCLKHFSF
jgi:hypothetical protein